MFRRGSGAIGTSSFYCPAAPDEERSKVTSAFLAGVVTSSHTTLVFSQMLDAVYEAGCTNWDTADVYGDTEELIGKW
jgi:aryl-alcohol dehydrogenase-like predicted oxidoreductase